MRRSLSFGRPLLLNILLFISLVLSLAPPVQAGSYLWTQLPYIGETYGVGAWDQAWVNAINDGGQVVGHDQTAAIPRAFIWSASDGMQYYDNTIQPNLPLDFLDINNKGEIAGMGYYIPVYWSQKSGLMQLAEPSGYGEGFAIGINNKGEVVGKTYSPGFVTSRAISWNAQHIPQLLSLLPGKSQSAVSSTGNNGDVIGHAFNNYYVDNLAVLWMKNGGMKSFSPLPGDTQSVGYGANPKGEVVGYSIDPTGDIFSATLWDKKGDIQYLGNLAGFSGNLAAAINSSSQVVGIAYKLGTGEEDHRPFIWTKKAGIQDLNDLVQGLPAGVTLREAYDINNQGQIIVYGFDSILELSVHGVLTPITE